VALDQPVVHGLIEGLGHLSNARRPRIPYRILVSNMVSWRHGSWTQDYRGSAAGTSGESATGHRHRRHRNRSRRPEAGGCFGSLPAAATAAGQSSFLAYRRGAEGRPMIAADTNTWIAYLEGNEGPDTQLLDQTLEDRQVLMVPAVLTELLSDPNPS